MHHEYVLAQKIANIAGEAWIIFAPVVGAFGAFIAGSNTISNLTFTEFQYNFAMDLNFDPVLVVSMQAIGATAGNMIAIHNIVVASVTVGMVGKEWWVIKRTIIPTLFYHLALIIIAQAFSVLGILTS